GFTERQWSFEIGANYDRDFGPWSLSLVSLATRRYYRNHEFDLYLDDTASFDHTEDLQQHRNSGETILRGSLARDFDGRHHIEFGAEGAINTLDALVDDVIVDSGGPQIIDNANANVSITEHRAEIFASYTWRPNARWSVEARAANEFSTLDFSG